MPKVSVIINCYNGERYLKEAIDSVYSQTYKDWEIIFWDDASTDNSEQIAKSFDERLRYFKGKKALSLGQARNWAIEKAKGDFIAILDQDDIWMPEKLELQVSLFEKNTSVGLVFSDAIDFYQDTGKSISHFTNLGLNPPRGKIFKYLFTMDKYPISMPTAVFRRSALDSLSEWFDIRYKYAEEYDLFLRIAYNWECDYINKPLAIHRIHNASSTKIFHKEISIELSSVMEKIINYYPEIKVTLKKEIEKNKNIIALQYGKSLWQSGQKKEARQIFKKHIFYKKCFFFFLSTFFPKRFETHVLNLYIPIIRDNFMKLKEKLKVL
ncbi:MAG TPA: glycosyltransferase [Syntrophorhabdaceae bacterium]|nr:glycosyltransferase [Syntrophorhabdaceae bacterium]HPU29320.1 glycosyltransferase [Syntrophorhabdaceae bacterium]